MRLLIPVLLNCILVLAVYMADKYSPVKKVPYITKQIGIGILFGAVSAFASSYGVQWLGTTVNVRDAAFIALALSRSQTDILPENADFNGDSIVNVRDAAAIAKWLTENNKYFSPEKTCKNTPPKSVLQLFYNFF